MATMTNTVFLPETIANAFGRGKNRKELVKTLCGSGINPQVAETMVETSIRNYPSSVRAGAMAQVGTGAMLFVIGVVITGGTYAAASSGGGGFYLISWGPMVFGAVRILRGLFRLVTA